MDCMGRNGATLTFVGGTLRIRCWDHVVTVEIPHMDTACFGVLDFSERASKNDTNTCIFCKANEII